VVDFDDLSDVSLGGTAIASVTSITPLGGNTYDVLVTATTDGTVIATVPSNVASDAAGNGNDASTSTDNSVTYDATAPTVTIDQAPGQADPTNVAAITFRVQFSEPVNDFDDLSDVNVSGGGASVTSITPAGGNAYDVVVTATTDGVVTATVPAAVAKDDAGNDNAASTSTDNSVEYDATRPDVALTGGGAGTTNTVTFSVTATFTEPVYGFLSGDVVVGNGSVSNFTGVDGDTVFTFDVTATADGPVTVDVPANQADDLAGNGNFASNQLTWIYDGTAPTVALTGGGPADTNVVTHQVTATFSEPVYGFIDADVVVGNGSVSNFTGADGGTVFTFDVTATADGNVTVDVPGASATDLAGNDNTASNQLSWNYDGTAPTVTINQKTGQADPTNNPVVKYTVQFSEAVTGFGTDDVDTSTGVSATVDSVTPLGGNAYEVQITANADGVVVATVPAGGASDAAGNDNVDSTSTDNEITVDTQSPDVTVDEAPSQADPTNNPVIEFSVHFTEDVTGFDDELTDVTLGGTATATVTSITGSGQDYTVTVTATADGTVTIDVPAGAADDAAGNGNNASTAIDNEVTYDSTAPDTILDTWSVGNYTNQTSATFTFHSTEGDSTLTCTLNAGLPEGCTLNQSAGTGSQTYTGLTDGSYLFEVYATDAAGNSDATAAFYSWIVDTVAPTTTIDSENPATSPTNLTTMDFTFHANDANPIASLHCSLDGGAAVLCNSGSKSYTGLTGGSHTFEVWATDVAGNTNQSSPASYTWVIDLSAPNTVIDTQPANPTNSTTGSFTFHSTEPLGHLECKLDAGAYALCDSGSASYPGLSAGSHTFYVKATDSVGNTDPSPATYTWLIDTTPPDTTITSNPPASTPSTSATFTFTSSEALGSFECKLDAGAFAACSTPQNYSGLSVGGHTFQVRAYDQAGNVDPTPASYSWTVTASAATCQLCVMDASGNSALELTGNAQIKVTGDVRVNSTSNQAVNVGGNGKLTATGVIGGPAAPAGFKKTGNGVISPTPINQAATADPYAGLAMCPAAGAAACPSTNQGNTKVSGNTTTTINPGIYGSIEVSGNGKLNLNPGTYIVKTKLSVTGNGAINGSGVTFYFACSNYTTACAANTQGASFELTGNGAMTLSPPSSGAFAGMTIVYDRNNVRTGKISGNGSGFGGAIYMLNAALEASGNGGSLRSRVVVDTIKMSGNSNLNVTP
jgi:hypothetical protein